MFGFFIPAEFSGKLGVFFYLYVCFPPKEVPLYIPILYSFEYSHFGGRDFQRGKFWSVRKKWWKLRTKNVNNFPFHFFAICRELSNYKNGTKSALRAQLRKKIKFAVWEIKGNKVKARILEMTRCVYIWIFGPMFFGVWDEGILPGKADLFRDSKCDCGTIENSRGIRKINVIKTKTFLWSFLPHIKGRFKSGVRPANQSFQGCVKRKKAGGKRTKQERPRRLHRHEKANQGEESSAPVGEETWKWWECAQMGGKTQKKRSRIIGNYQRNGKLGGKKLNTGRKGEENC